ncbi:MAG: alpha/beta hydrolase [Hamadaea sp.]|nr:alpha/beta hydrolase [Hamadaea sp.]NUT07721.1 alpha/beta hydrolase [Hamadaea sp.]
MRNRDLQLRGDRAVEIETPRGVARAETIKPRGKIGSWLLLGHGAGGDVGSADLTAVTEAAVAAGVAVALVTQPYRVAGRKAPAPAPQLDEAWLAVVAELRRTAKIKVPLIVGGRSSGARVACRTALDSGAAGVVALAFPLHPPGRPEKTRDEELATGVPTLVVNGDRDPFGVPDARPGLDLVVLPGERHDLRKDPSAVAAAVVGWLRSHDWAR